MCRVNKKGFRDRQLCETFAEKENTFPTFSGLSLLCAAAARLTLPVISKD